MIGKVLDSKSTNTRINYAIPSDLLRALVLGQETVVTQGPARGAGGAYVGLRLFTLAGPGAPAYVDSIVPGSPADLAGLRKDDLILRVGSEYVDSCKAYLEQAAKFAPAVPVTLLVKRQEQVLPVRLTPIQPRPRPDRNATKGGHDGR
jgi:S1-C subfamily serine protease